MEESQMVEKMAVPGWVQQPQPEPAKTKPALLMVARMRA